MQPFISFQHLGPLEQQVLGEVWTRGNATARELMTASDGHAYTTLLATLERLWRKGLLTRAVEGRRHRYSPAFTEAELKRVVARQRESGSRELVLTSSSSQGETSGLRQRDSDRRNRQGLPRQHPTSVLGPAALGRRGDNGQEPCGGRAAARGAVPDGLGLESPVSRHRARAPGW
jgi:predicted transcriptional regulator